MELVTNETVQLISDKLTELMQVAGSKVTDFYPYVLRQQYIEVYLSLGFFIVVAILTTIFMVACCNDKLWEQMVNNKTECLILVPVVIFGFASIISGIIMFGFLPQLLNPHYYAVQDLMMMIK